MERVQTFALHIEQMFQQGIDGLLGEARRDLPYRLISILIAIRYVVLAECVSVMADGC